MTVTPDMVIAEAKKYLGWRYGYRDRCGGSYGELDCSGLICKVMNTLGLNIGCITSFVFAQLAFDHNLVIPKEKALEVPCLLIEGPNQGRGPSQRANGSDGHIILCDKTYSVEERGHAYGCVKVPLDWNRIQSFAIACWIPGVDYSKGGGGTPTSQFKMEQTMILQTHHYDGHGKAIAIPDKDSKGHYIYATVAPSFDGKGVDLDGGSSLREDQPTGLAGHRRYVPSDLGSARIVAVAAWNPHDGTVPGVILRYSDGRRHAVRFS